MTGTQIGRIAGTVGLLIVGIGHGATFSLSGPGQVGNTITVAPGASFTVSVQMDASEAGNTFEVFLGYDVSNANQAGVTGSPTLNKLTLVSSLTDVAESIDGGRFDVWRSAKAATGRETNNAALGGRPYGLKIVGAGYANTAAGSLTLFSATFRNSIPVGQSYCVVISDAGTGASYTSGWKHGTTTNRGTYVLQVVSAGTVTPTPAPLPGDANHDNRVTFEDFSILQNHYGQSGIGWDQGDFNGDGRVTFEDFSILQNRYGQSQSGSVPAAETAPATALPCGSPSVIALVLLGITLFGRVLWRMDE